jgi:hypothetical protein
MGTVPRRRCPRCKKDKPQTRGYFYLMTDGTWSVWCRKCKLEVAQVEREVRKQADYKRRAGLRLTKAEQRAADAAERQREASRRHMAKKRAAATEEVRADQRERARKYRDENVEFVRERNRMYYRMRVGDRVQAPSASVRHYKRHLTKAERELPVEPFAKWIEDTFGSMAKVEAPVHLGISVREVEHVIGREHSTVTLPIVDRALG